MDFVNNFAWSHPSQLRVFVRFENSSLPRIWKVSDLVFIFNKMMVKGVKKEELKDHELASCYHHV